MCEASGSAVEPSNSDVTLSTGDGSGVVHTLTVLGIHDIGVTDTEVVVSKACIVSDLAVYSALEISGRGCWMLS